MTLIIYSSGDVLKPTISWIFAKFEITLRIIKPFGELIGLLLTVLAIWDWATFGWKPDSNFLRVLFSPRISCSPGGKPTYQGENYLYKDFQIKIEKPRISPLSGQSRFMMQISFPNNGSGHFLNFKSDGPIPPLSLSSYGSAPHHEVTFPFRFVDYDVLEFKADLVSNALLGENTCDLTLSLQ